MNWEETRAFFLKIQKEQDEGFRKMAEEQAWKEMQILDEWLKEFEKSI